MIKKINFILEKSIEDNNNIQEIKMIYDLVSHFFFEDIVEKNRYKKESKKEKKISVDEFLNLIKNSNIEDSIKENIFFESFDIWFESFNIWDDRFIELVKDIKINNSIKWYILDLLRFMPKSNYQIIRELTGMLKSEKVSDELKQKIIEMLGILEYVNIDIITILYKYIKDKSVHSDEKYMMLEAYTSIGEYNNEILPTIGYFIENKFYNLESSHSTVPLFNLLIIFKLYDKSYSIIDFLLKTSLEKRNSLYIKNNKLCTIENGKEIFTKRDVDDEFLNNLNILLKDEKND